MCRSFLLHESNNKIIIHLYSSKIKQIHIYILFFIIYLYIKNQWLIYGSMLDEIINLLNYRIITLIKTNNIIGYALLQIN